MDRRNTMLLSNSALNHQTAYYKVSLFVIIVVLLTSFQCSSLPSGPNDVTNRIQMPQQQNVTTNGDVTGVKVCLDRQTVRFLIQLAVSELASVAATFQYDDTTQNSTARPPKNPFGDLTEEELKKLCEELCSYGVCPPGCPGNYKPPWGRR